MRGYPEQQKGGKFMAEGLFISYLRVSTAEQGRSGLGLEAQRAAVQSFLNGGQWDLLKEYVEVESGKKSNRPQLQKALEHCRLTGATLLIAKLDRLSRDAHFLTGLQNSGTPFKCADMPYADKLTVGIMAMVAQAERETISKRTKDALAAAKARGKKLGCPNGAKHLRKYGNEAAVKAIVVKANNKAESLRSVIDELHAQESFQALQLPLN
jgi:DNA invertase Pin-like site-specific DNA recombinase